MAYFLQFSDPMTLFRTLHGQVPDLPIVVLSDYDDDRLALQAVRQGAQDYLVKGQGDGEVLVRTIRYATERSHMLRMMAQ